MEKKQNLINISPEIENYYAGTRPEMIDFIPKSAKRILEVGCGEAFFGSILKKKLNAEVWGVEINENCAAKAKENIDKVIIGDIVQLLDNLPDKYFDCVIFNDVLEHLINPYIVLFKIKNKLNLNGRVVCSIPNVRYFWTLVDLIVKKQWEYAEYGILDKTHLRFFTLKSIINMFNELGYEILKLEGINSIKSWKYTLINIIFLGHLSDTKYLEFACVAKPKEL